jgi:hypothetical protein
MSPQTKKLKKEKNRLKRQEEARSPLYQFMNQHPVLLDLSPKQLLACIRVSRVLPKMNKSTVELIVDLIQKTDFTRDNVRLQFKIILLNPSVLETITLKRLSPSCLRRFLNPVIDGFSFMTPDQLLEFVKICQACRTEEYTESLIDMFNVEYLRPLVGVSGIEHLRYEDVDLIMDLVRVNKVMES